MKQLGGPGAFVLQRVRDRLLAIPSHLGAHWDGPLSYEPELVLIQFYHHA